MNKRSPANISNRYNSLSVSKRKGERRKAFWFPAPQYYSVSALFVLITFLFICWVFNEPYGGIPWFSAGFVALLLMAGAVVLREVVLKIERNKYLAATRRLDQNIRTVDRSSAASPRKFSLSQNAKLLGEIEEKSKAAQTFINLPDAHLEVFEKCEAYLKFTEKELNRIDVNSPRFGSVRRGRGRVRELHRYHILAWASVESAIYTQAARDCDTIVRKIENAKMALDVLNVALEFYPREVDLLESAEIVKVTIASTEISLRIAEAEQAAENGENGVAIGKYKDALFYLARESVGSHDVEKLAERINIEINRLREIAED